MAIPFASGYAPINLLNDAIQNQAARQQQGYLQASALNDASVADSLNRIVQQKALQQQAQNQQAHYGLQQQQLANDMSYRNALLKEAEMRAVQQGNQFDKQFGLNEKIANAQINNPFYGQKDALAFGLQAGQDVAAHNAAATAIASQATGALAAARQAYKADVAQINDPNWYEALGRHLPFTNTKQDLLNSAKARFDATYNKLLGDLGPHRDKVSFVGTPEENGTFQPVLLSPPTMPGGRQQQFDGGAEAPDVGRVNIGSAQGPGQGTGEGVISTPFSEFQSRATGGAPEIRPDAAVAPVAAVNPFTAFLQRQLYGNSSPIRTNVPPAVVVAPGAPNRIFRYDPNAGLVPLQ